MLLKYQAVCDIGNVRENNEDMAYVAGKLLRDGSSDGEIEVAEDCVAFAVADGMGGYSGGEVASEIVCRSFGAFVKTHPLIETLSELKEWAIEANRLVLETASLREDLAEMGSTFVALLFTSDKIYLINVGDSRCYRIRDGVLKQISVDHSERERTGNPDVPSNLIYNFMGNDPREFISDITDLKPIAGDTYLLCSDGLSDLISDDAIEANYTDPHRLLALAKAAGARDNITALTIRLTSGEQPHTRKQYNG